MMRTRTSSSLTFCLATSGTTLRGGYADGVGGGGWGAWSRQVQVLYAAATLAHEFLADKERVAPRALVDTAVYLHDIVLSLQGLQGEALRRVIAKVCEMWWTQDRPGAEHLVVHLIPVMLVRSLSPDAKEADVKRMHAVKGALLLLDFEDESSDSLRALLLRTFMSPVYLKSSEGKRLLASFFGLHPSLVSEIHAVMKAQMPGAKKAVLAAYGEVYFRVWRGAEGQYLEKVEMLCLQDLMHACIHASTPKMHQNILVVLEGLHSQKKAKGVDADLLRLYGPVMWRSLRVANPSVRAQGYLLSGVGAAAYDATLQQQFVALTDLLEDAHPQVRAVAGKGACRVLSVFWEMVPLDTTRALLTRVVGRLASDGSSPAVRLAAVEGLSVLLECPASHAVLKSMLPVSVSEEGGVQNLIHDTNKKVRTAFVKLLLVVKGVKSIKYYQVATVDHILARLSEDHAKCPASASGLSKLILNSYFPTGSGVTGSFQVSRCLTLLSQDEGAAVAFFSRLHQNAGVPSSAKMIAMLVRCILVAARAPAVADNDDEEEEKEKKKVDRRGKRKGVEEGGGHCGAKGGNKARLTLKASDSKTMSGILNLIASIWESILPALEKTINEPSLDLIQQTVTGEALSILYRRFCGQDECRAAFMRLAGLAGGDLAPGMLEDVVVEMLALPADAPPSAYGPTVDLLCSWGQHEHLVGAVVESLRKFFSAPRITTTTAVDEAGSGEMDDGDHDEGGRGGGGMCIPAPLALNMLGHLLAGGEGHPSTGAARDAIMASDEAVGSLEAVLVLARSATTTRLSSSSASTSSALMTTTTTATVKREDEEKVSLRRRCPDALLVRALEALGRVYMHREAAVVGDSSSGNLPAAVADEGSAAAGDDMSMLLQPMPFSVKMRELMVWATNTVLPVLVGGGGGGGPAVDMVEEGGTPGAAAVRALAGGVFGVVVLLASEWVEVGSGLAEISMRADTWGNRLLASLLQGVRAIGCAIDRGSDSVTSGCCPVGPVERKYEQLPPPPPDHIHDPMMHVVASQEGDGHEGQGHPSGVNAVLPQLCRLGLHLSAREAQGARPPASIWDETCLDAELCLPCPAHPEHLKVLMRCADRRVSMSEEALFVGEEERGKATCVQSFLAASVALEGRKDGMSSLVERLMAFMFTQAFISDEEEEQDLRERDKGPSIDGLTRLEIRAVQDLDSDEPPGCLLLQLSRPAAAVLESVLRSSPASKAAGSLVLSHLAAFGDASGRETVASQVASWEDASWPLFCAHVLVALIENAPAKTRLQLAAEAHAGLRAAAASTSTLSSSFSFSEGDKSGAAVSPARADAPEEEEGVSTRKAAAFAVGAIYGRLEAARRAAVTGVGGEAQGVAVEGAAAAVAVSA
ncbi:unnamed protein product [Ectocarpus sp. CCAP 1310/34]|nr:unnamed protein product [Ectocarpus sp. CCAP 1310/34]